MRHIKKGVIIWVTMMGATRAYYEACACDNLKSKWEILALPFFISLPIFQKSEFLLMLAIAKTGLFIHSFTSSTCLPLKFFFKNGFPWLIFLQTGFSLILTLALIKEAKLSVLADLSSRQMKWVWTGALALGGTATLYFRTPPTTSLPYSLREHFLVGAGSIFATYLLHLYEKFLEQPRPQGPSPLPLAASFYFLWLSIILFAANKESDVFMPSPDSFSFMMGMPLLFAVIGILISAQKELNNDFIMSLLLIASMMLTANIFLLDEQHHMVSLTFYVLGGAAGVWLEQLVHNPIFYF